MLFRSLRTALWVTADRSRLFLRNAGTVILAICVAMWWLSAYPKATPSPAIEARLAEELDYRQEAANIEEFRRFFDGDPDILVPRVYEGWSTARVLTMGRVPGRPLPVFLATGSTAAKERAGVALGTAFMRAQYLLRTIHGDPHPGNYLFTPDGRVGILDFGCVRRLELDWIASYGECGLATRYEERERLMQASMRIRALTHRGDAESEDVLWDLCRTIGIPFRGGPYTMGGPQDDVHERISELVPQIGRAHD